MRERSTSTACAAPLTTTCWTGWTTTPTGPATRASRTRSCSLRRMQCGVPGGDQQLLRRVRTRGRSYRQRRLRVGDQRIPRQPVGVPPQYRSERGGILPAPLRQRSFRSIGTSSAAAFGGPIVKNRFFFFADYEGFRQIRNIPAVQTVAYGVAAPGHLARGHHQSPDWKEVPRRDSRSRQSDRQPFARQVLADLPPPSIATDPIRRPRTTTRSRNVLRTSMTSLT